MRADRGYLCANEIQIGMAIPDAELALFRHKMSGSAFFDTVQLARRWTGPEAKTAGFVRDTADLDGLMDKAMDIAQQMAHLGANRELFSHSKERIFGEGPSITSRMARRIYNAGLTVGTPVDYPPSYSTLASA